MKDTKIVLITGASSGIGEACAHLFAQNGYKVIVCGRRKQKLETLAQKLTEKYKSSVLCLPFDVRNFEETRQAIENLAAPWAQIDILINNAGLALGISPIHEGTLADWNQMIDTNVKGLLHVSKCIIPSMTARNSGHIINIGSIAGKEVYLNGNIYCASKAAVDALTKAMRIDLLKFGIKVTQVAPGAVATEFSQVRFKGDETAAKKVYDGFTPLTPQDVAGVVYYTATLPAHVNINDVIVVPTAQANTTHTNRKV
ncbi:MAG: SDR family NAD(P)-dependent oxidoreductase [Bacteroidota bacterium]